MIGLKRTVTVIVSVFMALSLGFVASAEEEDELDYGIEELVVTAQKRAQAQQDVPIGISAFTSQFLEDGGIDVLDDLVAFVPGLTGGDVGIGSPIFAIRGISSNSFGVGGEMSVGVFLDEGYIGRNRTSSIVFMDVARVEVLKGPQGTLFGRNASAGAISLVSNKPEDGHYAQANFVGGNYEKLAGSLTMNVPIVSEKLFARGTFMTSHRNGYNHNTARDYEEQDDEETYAGKMAFRFLPKDGIDNTTSYILQRDKFKGAGYKNAFNQDIDAATPGVQSWDQTDGPIALVPIPTPPFATPAPLIPALGYPEGGDPDNAGSDPFNGRTVSDFEGGSDRWVHNLNNRLFFDLTDDITLTSVTTFGYYEFDSSIDGDATALPLLGVKIDDENSTTFGQELRLTGFWREINWMAGASYFREDIETDFQTYIDETFFLPAVGGITDPFGAMGPPGAFACAPAPPPVEPCNADLVHSIKQEGNYDSYAIYGDGTWAATDELNVTLGLRYSIDVKKFKYKAPVEASRLSAGPAGQVNLLGFRAEDWEHDKKTWDLAQPRVALDYHLTPDIMIYGSTSRGFKSGGFDPTVLDADGNDQNRFDPEKVWAYEIGFKSTWWDNRVQLNMAGFYNDYEDFQLQTLDGSKVVTRNASDVETYGIEGEIIVEPLRGWELFAGGTWLEAEFGTFKEDVASFTDPTGYETVSFSNKTLPRSPQGTFSLVSQYEHEVSSKVNAVVRGESAYTTKVYFSHRNEGLESQGAYWIFNLRAGLQAPDQTWQVVAFVKNVADENYLIDTRAPGFGIIRYAGPPRFYGLELTAKLDGMPDWF